MYYLSILAKPVLYVVVSMCGSMVAISLENLKNGNLSGKLLNLPTWAEQLYR